jgi:hypothetical protein
MGLQQESVPVIVEPLRLPEPAREPERKTRMRTGMVAALLLSILTVAGCGGSTKTVTRTVGSSPAAPSAQVTSLPRDFVGTTSQGLPISFTVTSTSVESIQFAWRALCSDGQTHSNTIALGGASIASGNFSASGRLDTGASSALSGHVSGRTATGQLSRSGPSAFGTNCSATDVRWSAQALG